MFHYILHIKYNYLENCQIKDTMIVYTISTVYTIGYIHMLIIIVPL